MALVTSVVVGAAATAYGAYSQRKSAKAAERANRAQQRQADIANARERRAAVRNRRIAMASVESQGALTGISGSSGIEGSLANISSRMGENLAFLGQNEELAAQASNANIQAARWASRAATAQSISNMATTFGTMYGGPSPTPKPGGGSVFSKTYNNKGG